MDESMSNGICTVVETILRDVEVTVTERVTVVHKVYYEALDSLYESVGPRYFYRPYWMQ